MEPVLRLRHEKYAFRDQNGHLYLEDRWYAMSPTSDCTLAVGVSQDDAVRRGLKEIARCSTTPSSPAA